MKRVTVLLILVLLAGAAAGVQPRILQVSDSLGHTFNVTESPRGVVIIYGRNHTRYVRILEEVEVADGQEIQVCVDEVEGDGDVTFNYMLQTYDHPDNVAIEEPVTDRCHGWEVDHSRFRDKLHVSIWARNQDSTYTHSNFTETDSYVEFRYENVAKVEGEGAVESREEVDGGDDPAPDRSREMPVGLLDRLIDFLAGLLSVE